jgi:hypothetical protein
MQYHLPPSGAPATWFSETSESEAGPHPSFEGRGARLWALVMVGSIGEVRWAERKEGNDGPRRDKRLM